MELGVLSLARNQNVLPRLAKRIAEELEEAYEFKSGRDQRFVLIYLLSSHFFSSYSLGDFPAEVEKKVHQ